MTESNNPPLPEPPPDMSGFGMTTIREGAPKRAEPRREKKASVRTLTRKDWDALIVLALLLIIFSFIASFAGTMLGNAWR